MLIFLREDNLEYSKFPFARAKWGFSHLWRRCVFCLKVVNHWLGISHSDPSGQNLFLPFFPASHALILNPNPTPGSINFHYTSSFPSGLVTNIFVFNLKDLFRCIHWSAMFFSLQCWLPSDFASFLLSFSICCATRCRSGIFIFCITAYIAASHPFILGCKVYGIKGSKLWVSFLDIVIPMKTWI